MAYFAYVCVIWLSTVLTCMLSYKFLPKLQLHEMPSQDFIRCLNDSRFGVDFKWDGKLFQIFGPKTLMLFSLYLTWFGLVIYRFKTCSFRTGFIFESDNLKASIIKFGLKLLILIHFYTEVTQSSYRHCAFLRFG